MSHSELKVKKEVGADTGKHLGAKSEYVDKYDASLLVREPRINNRKRIGLTNDNLPFTGFDAWNVWEFSGILTKSGVPFTALIKIRYSSDNAYIVESKSLKLYLGSFCNSSWGDTEVEAYKNVQAVVSRDLTNLLETPVSVDLFNVEECDIQPDMYMGRPVYLLEKECDLNTIKITHYDDEDSSVLLDTAGEPVHDGAIYKSNLLRSRCKITLQQDTGTIFFYAKWSDKKPNAESLLKYIITHRNSYGFHEEVLETTFEHIRRTFNPKDLAIACLYNRRGGIDINPVRSTSLGALIDSGFSQVGSLGSITKLSRQ